MPEILFHFFLKFVSVISMKFLVLTQFYTPETGAAQTRLKEFTTALAGSGHDVEVFTALPNYPQGQIFDGYKGKFYSVEDQDRIKIHRVWLFAAQGRSLSRLFCYFSFTFFSFFAFLVCNKPDYIFVNSGPLFLILPARFLASFFDCKLILNVADLWPRSVEKLDGAVFKFLLKFGQGLENWAYKTSDYVVAVTEGIRTVLLTDKKIPPAKVLFLPNGVNTQLFDPENQGTINSPDLKHILEKKFVFTYPGNHGYAHALDNVLLAAYIVMKAAEKDSTLSQIHILLIGDGSEKKRLVEKSQEMKLSNLSFHDPVSSENLVPVLKKSDVGLINVKNSALALETRPAKMFPLMAMGKAILFSGFGEGAALLSEVQGGIVVAPENPKLMAQEMINFYQRKYDLDQMGHNNRKFVKTKMEFSTIINDWLTDLFKREGIVPKRISL